MFGVLNRPAVFLKQEVDRYRIMSLTAVMVD